ncbi:MAG: hypothetical protein A3C36_03455 [Omnitrophica WOR_2 bacterium RIFCSPHIGHO2_02_FULL_52_10]|nr:MAG: hypothetical protein A3C36_03455 [Omnitrophica WOR_2 bacterium RIFCSPHIGHO2_02_FULL_52_10]
MLFRPGTGKNKGQTAIEYMMLLAAVVAIILVGFKNYLPRFYEASNIYFNRVGVGIYGEPPRCGDGCCGPIRFFGNMSEPCPAAIEDSRKCPTDCGT